MGLGILEPRSGDAPLHIPGTATLLHDDEGNAQKRIRTAIILVPKPSESPRDPLVSAISKCRTLRCTYV